MKTQIKKNEHRKAALLVAPYATLIRVGNAVISIGRGSFSTIEKMTLHRPELLEKPTLVAEIGQYCEFNPSSKLVIGGEHLNQGKFINTFSDSFHIRQNIPNKSLIAPITKGPIIIGSNVILSAGAIVLSGSTIGNNVLVAAGALVNGSYASNQIIGGVPATHLRTLDEPQQEWWNMAEESIAEYVNSGRLDYPKPNRTADLRLVFDAKQNKLGGIGEMNLSGLTTRNNFIPFSDFLPKHLAYFNDSNTDDPFMTISDEVFDDLL
jgi:acetyltransferase-like isoleucine patch superfamily enzyme